MTDLGTQLDVVATAEGLRLVGEIDAFTAPRLDEALDERVDGATRIVLDVAGVTFMDSSGLRVVIRTTERSRTGGGDLVLAQPTAAVRRLLEISGLTDHLTIEPAAD